MSFGRISQSIRASQITMSGRATDDQEGSKTEMRYERHTHIHTVDSSVSPLNLISKGSQGWPRLYNPRRSKGCGDGPQQKRGPQQIKTVTTKTNNKPPFWSFYIHARSSTSSAWAATSPTIIMPPLAAPATPPPAHSPHPHSTWRPPRPCPRPGSPPSRLRTRTRRTSARPSSWPPCRRGRS